jgi:endonuclease/exonuclease/phosphatase family metal-dependent hydrolase
VRVVAWNIQHGGGPERFPRIVLALLDLRADVIALTEFRGARGGQLAAMLASHGLGHVLTSRPHGASPHANGILLVSRFALVRLPSPEVPAAMEPRVLAARVAHPAGGDVAMVVAHVPDDTRPNAKAAVWRGLLGFASAHAQQRTLLVGDFNTARREDISIGRATRGVAAIGQLAAWGYRDAWTRPRAVPAHASANDPQVPTTPVVASWRGPRGERARIDAAYASRALGPSLLRCEYAWLGEADADGRQLSDHAAILLEIA